MKYFVIQTSSAATLTESVNLALKQGWKLQGGMSVGGDGGYRFFCQAMIKEERPQLAINPLVDS